MNAGQGLRQIAYLLATRCWTGSNEKILAGGAFGAPSMRGRRVDFYDWLQETASEYLGEVTCPFACVRRRWANGDVNAPGRYASVDYEVQVATENWFDARSSSQMAGANREGQTVSGGRGADEVVAEITQLLRRLTDHEHGIHGWVERIGQANAQASGIVYTLTTFNVAALNVTAAPYYHPARRLKVTGTVASWALPPTRFDLLRMVMRRGTLAGDPAPSTPTGGTGVPLSGDLATSINFGGLGLAAGTYNFALFVAYDESSPSPTTPDRYSAALTGSVTV